MPTCSARSYQALRFCAAPKASRSPGLPLALTRMEATAQEELQLVALPPPERVEEESNWSWHHEFFFFIAQNFYVLDICTDIVN